MLEPKIVYPEILTYIQNMIPEPPEKEVFKKIHEQAVKEERPVVSNDIGLFLHLLIKLIKAENILEIGCSIGCSALWMATALSENGKIDTIDVNRETAAQAKKYFSQACVLDKICIHLGSAQQILPGIDRMYDLLFIDAAKQQYKDYLDLSLPKIKPGGLILADNVLWNGKVAGIELPSASDDKLTKSLQEFNEYFMKHKSLKATILSIGDGLGFAIKNTE